jgi:hypothetical protein
MISQSRAWISAALVEQRQQQPAGLRSVGVVTTLQLTRSLTHCRATSALTAKEDGRTSYVVTVSDSSTRRPRTVSAR